ncbi:HERC1, partial [Symbiodinium microadriaticum]
MSIEEEMDRLRTFFSELYQVTAAGATGNAKVTHILRIRTKLRPRSMAHSGEHGDDQLIQAQAEFAQFGAYMKAGLPSSTGAPSGATSTAPSLGDTEATEDQSKEMDVDRDRRRTQRDEGEINPPPQKWAKGDQKGVDKPQEPVSGKGGQVLKDNVEPSTRTPGSGSTQPIPTPSPTTAARDKETRTDRDRKQDQNQDTRRSQQNRSWNQQHGYRSWPTRRGDKEDLKEVIRAMGRLSLRLEDQLSVFSLDVEFILFLQTDSSGNKFSITASLYAAAQQWHRQKESDPASLTQPMRNILLYCLFSALLERLEKLETDPDMMAQVRKHIKAQVEPLSHREAVESVRVLLRLTTFPHVVGRFHALRKLTAAPSGDVIPFTLMAQNRTAESHQLYTLMHRLARNSVWHLIGSTMRPTKIGRSPLAKQLDKMIQHAACDLPPWLPLQVSRFNAAHEKITTPVHFSPAIYLPVFTGTSKFSGHYRTALCQSGQLRFLTDDGVEATQEPTHVGDADRHPCFDVAENPGRVTSLSTSMACLSPQSFEMGAKTTDFGTPINVILPYPVSTEAWSSVGRSLAASGLAALAPLAEGMYQLKLNSCRSGDCATRFEGFLNIIREVWKTTCIGIVKDSNYESERAVMCFVTLHFLLLCLAQDHPQLREHTAATVREFLERIDAAPSENLKTAVPDLGRFLVRFLLMESELSLRDHLAPIVRELFRRNVRWVHPDHWADGDASEDEKEEQVDAAFEASQFGMKLLVFQTYYILRSRELGL